MANFNTERFFLKHPVLYNFHYLFLRNSYRGLGVYRRNSKLNIDAPDKIKMGNFEMYINPDNEHDKAFVPLAMNNELYEPSISKFFMDNVKAGETFLDIGANNGYYSLLLSAALGGNLNVYAFEPYLPSFEKLLANRALNKLENIRPYMIALSDKYGAATLYKHYFEDGRNTLTPIDKDEITDSETVALGLLDDYVTKADWIKIDVEGHEYEVLKGGEKLLKNNQDIKIIFEYNFVMMRQKKMPYNLIFDYLHRLGFKTEEIDIDAGMMGVVNSFKDLRRFGTYVYCHRN